MSTASKVLDLVRDDRIEEAARAAASATERVEALVSGFDASDLDEHAEAFSRFASLWLDTAAVADRLPIAAWISDRALLEWSHVDGVRNLAAHALVRSARAVLAEIAGRTEGAWVYADGPDAGITRTDAEAIKRAGQHAAGIEWPEM